MIWLILILAAVFFIGAFSFAVATMGPFINFIDSMGRKL